jgi:hypothetical protein
VSRDEWIETKKNHEEKSHFLHLAFALCSGQQPKKVYRRSLTRSWQLGDISSGFVPGDRKRKRDTPPGIRQ